MVSVMLAMGVIGRAPDGVGLMVSLIARELVDGISVCESLGLAGDGS